MPPREGTYGLLAEFDTPSDLVRAAQAARHDGWRRLDCYTPYPVEEAAEAIGFHRNKVPLVTLVGGLMACGDVWHGDVGLRAGVSVEYRGTSDVLMAGIYYSRLRVDDFVRGLRRPSACWR